MDKHNNSNTGNGLAVNSASTGSDSFPYRHSLEVMLSNLSACAAERALAGGWEKNPMAGILSDGTNDKWAVAYREQYKKIINSRREIEDFYFQNTNVRCGD